MSTPTYGLIGRGRLATHLAHYLGLENQDVVQWHRGAGRAAAGIVSAAEVVLLAISDDAIKGFIDGHPEIRNRTLVHFSGSLAIDAASGLHPLMTFGPELYDLETYRAIPFVGESEGARFDEIFPGLHNPSRTIDRDLKPLYHALCVLAGNFTTISWTKAMDDFEARLDLPREILRPFLERTAANTLDHGRAALTGSLARDDHGSIRRDLEGLDNDPFREVYLAYAHATATGDRP
ncbi:MAG: DUF2520 domain-containing protein [Thermoanaerobaculales bacterium]|nr:DUF2520 domain-containing protein [Thermoanaerobaculales bacterium]